MSGRDAEWAIGVALTVVGSVVDNCGCVRARVCVTGGARCMRHPLTDSVRSITMQKYSHLRNALLETPLQRPYIQQRLWWAGAWRCACRGERAVARAQHTGFVIFLCGNLINVAGLGFAPQTLFAAVGGTSLVANAM